FLFFVSATPPPYIYTLSLHDALPIYSCRPSRMSEKPESEEFEDEEADEPVAEDGDVDLDQVIKDLDLAKRRGQKVGEIEILDDLDRKSTRLNSSHLVISYAVFCLKKK